MKITRYRLREIIKEELSRMPEAGLAGHQTEPRHEGNTPEERLINKLLIRSKIEKAGGDPQRAAEMLGLGDDEEVIAYLANLMGNPMFDNPNMEEGGYAGHAIQSGGKPPKPEKQHSEASYNPKKEIRKAFHKKSRNVAKQDIQKGEIEEGKKASKTRRAPPYREQGSTESQAQQMAAGAALSARRGDAPVSKLKGASKDLYHGKITTKELRNLAKLGQKVKGHKSKEPKHRKSLPGHATPAKD